MEDREEDADVEAGTGHHPTRTTKALVIDESKSTYETRRRGRQQRADNDRNQHHVTFSEIILVTPYRDASSSVPHIITEGTIVVSKSDGDIRPPEALLTVKKTQRAQSLVNIIWTTELLLALLWISSAIEFLFAIDVCMNMNKFDDFFALAVAAGAVSTVVATALLAWMRVYKKMDFQIFGFALSVLCVWWFAAALALTVPADAPFRVADNGFFTTWLSFALSVSLLSLAPSKETVLLLTKMDALDKGRNRQLLILCLLTLLIVISSSGVCAQRCDDMAVFALVWSVCSFLAASFLFQMWREFTYFKFFAFLLAAELSLGLAVVTIIGPFDRVNGPGLGYFASWFSTVFAWIVVFSRDPRRGDEDDDDDE